MYATYDLLKQADNPHIELFTTIIAGPT